ncbi:hypothetical protein GPECTOR_1g11 [Gonium pectorale]|uniref:Uncharacterized protein n=1 Tax=Gonium pectorale TaxID=33097 RepID=A0A150H3J8_GONPE|nr:hypothetical protein GPECTOR_1g11 [Gonium pectorale]|eukprot:KXZ56130.1 hypothetical protein GPECTOR_1g11 [Gonium pectorale]
MKLETTTAPLQDVSRLTQLTRLELELLGIMDYGAPPAPSCYSVSPSDRKDASGAPPYNACVQHQPQGLLQLVSRGLAQLQELHLECRSADVDLGHLCATAVQCPALRHLKLHAPLATGSGSTGALPRRLRALRIHNTRKGPLTDLTLDATAATPAGLAAALPRARRLRSLELLVAGQESAASLGSALSSTKCLERLEVVLPGASALGFVAECVRGHLGQSLPGVVVRLRPQQNSD